MMLDFVQMKELNHKMHFELIILAMKLNGFDESKENKKKNSFQMVDWKNRERSEKKQKIFSVNQT